MNVGLDVALDVGWDVSLDVGWDICLDVSLAEWGVVSFPNLSLPL